MAQLSHLSRVDWCIEGGYGGFVGPVRPILLVLLSAAGFVLLVACANIAGLLVARGATRLQEIEIRSALGASRGRIVRQLMTESLVLAVPGAILGLILGQYAVRLFVLSIPRAQRAALPHLASFSIDPLHTPRNSSATRACRSGSSSRTPDAAWTPNE